MYHYLDFLKSFKILWSSGVSPFQNRNIFYYRNIPVMQIGVLLSRQKSFIKRTLTFSRLAVDFCQRKNSLGTCNSVHYGVQQVQASPNFLVACLQWQERKFQRWLLRENGEQERGIIHAVQSAIQTNKAQARNRLVCILLSAHWQHDHWPQLHG